MSHYATYSISIYRFKLHTVEELGGEHLTAIGEAIEEGEDAKRSPQIVQILDVEDEVLMAALPTPPKISRRSTAVAGGRDAQNGERRDGRSEWYCTYSGY